MQRDHMVLVVGDSSAMDRHRTAGCDTFFRLCRGSVVLYVQEGEVMKYRVELEVADHLIQDGFEMTEDILHMGLQMTVQKLGDRNHVVCPEDVKATIIQEVRFRSNIENFMWECCDVRSDYWVESSRLFRIWCTFRSDYKGGLSSGRFGRLISGRFPHITWARKWVEGKQISIYRGVRLRDIYVGVVSDEIV
ncbi:hypothetical protein LCGC14_0342940 [marine sediment metagenome]|uniref:Uncharacterized protein n=1 Tax=marine sediment metagenome TaxID=412755 RepID=A0A0F9W0C6_9ZZZZ